MRIALGATLTLAALLLAQDQRKSAEAGHLKMTERFVGKVAFKGPQQAEVTVAIHTWIIDERQRIEPFELPAKGLTVVQVRGGTLISTVNGQKQKRKTDEYFTVPAGASWGIETEGDAVILQTTVITP